MLRATRRIRTPSEAGGATDGDYDGTVNRRRQGRPPPGPTFIDQMPLVDVPATGIASDTADAVVPSSNPDAATSFIRSGRVPLFLILHADADGPITVPSDFTANGTFAGTLNAMFSISSAYACRIPMPPKKKANRQTATTRTARMLIIAERRQEAVSDMKKRTPDLSKRPVITGQKNGTTQDEVYSHLAENDMRGSGIGSRERIGSIYMRCICFACNGKSPSCIIVIFLVIVDVGDEFVSKILAHIAGGRHRCGVPPLLSPGGTSHQLSDVPYTVSSRPTVSCVPLRLQRQPIPCRLPWRRPR